MSSNDASESNGKTNNKCSTITRDYEHSSESQEVKEKFTGSPEFKESVYISKKIAKRVGKQSKQGPEDKDKRYVHCLTEESNSTYNETQRSNLQVRYWTYLFDNLHRSIDEIFCACESEENVSGCHVCE